MTRRRPREDESALWRAVTGDVRPLKKRGPDQAPPPPKPVLLEPAAAKPKPRPKARPAAPLPPAKMILPPPELEHGKATGIDRRS